MLGMLMRSFAQKASPRTKVWRIVKGDTVQVISGSDKGKRGIVERVFRGENRVLVKGINLKVKHQKQDESNQETGKFLVEAPIHYSNVAHVDPETEQVFHSKPSKIDFGYLEDGTKVRVTRKSGALIPWPDRSEWLPEVRFKDVKDGLKDTPPELVLKQTYFGEDYDAIKQRFDNYIREQEADAKWLVFKS